MARISVRFSLGLLLGLGAPALAGCDPQDPTWALPCDERPAREVQAGTGLAEFRPASAGLHVEHGNQGGEHIWVAVRLRGFGPEAEVDFGIRDAASPDVYSGPNQERAFLVYNPSEDASEATGMFGFLEDRWDPVTELPLPGPSGRSVVVWANVTDDCTPEPVYGEATGPVL